MAERREEGEVASRVTIIDVAAKAGVAISSVSSALNNRPGVSEKTRARILQAANELGFVPSIRARSLSAKRAFTVGLVVQRDPYVLESDPFFGSFIGGIETVLNESDYALILQMGSGTAETLDRYRVLAANRRVDGVFLSELTVDDPRIPLVHDLGLPAIGINAEPAFPFPAVRQDHARGIQALVDHLVGLGHRRFALVTGPSDFIHSGQRRAAWTSALEAAGQDAGVVVEGDFTYEGGVAAAGRLLGGGAGVGGAAVGGARGAGGAGGAGGAAGAVGAVGAVGAGAVGAAAGAAELPTAVMCSNDLSAIGFIARASELGFRVPEDISVAGFDGIELGTYVRPALTTIATSPRLIGQEAARMLLRSIAGEAVADVDIEPVALAVRGSTGVVPGAGASPASPTPTPTPSA